MKNTITSQATGGKKPSGARNLGFRIAHNYQAYLKAHKPSKHAKQRKIK